MCERQPIAETAVTPITRRKPPFWLARAGQYLWRQWLIPILPVLLVLGTVRGSLADWYDVPTGSMRPTIEIGDRILVNKLAFGLRIPFTSLWLATWGQPQRGEIVVFRAPDDGTVLVKRVVGLPGDTIELRNNQLRINGQTLAYSGPNDFIQEIAEDGRMLRQIVATESLAGHAHPVCLSPELPAMRSFATLKVPADSYFVMGDSRDRSRDSRYFGCVPRANVLGRSGRVAFSLDRDRWYLPRLKRFLHALP